MQSAGYSWNETIAIGTTFSSVFSNANGTNSPVYWGIGYNSSKNGILPQPVTP
jgi:hypothetical protein